MRLRGLALRPRTLALAGAALLLLNGAAIALAIHFSRPTGSEVVPTRAEPIADLLAWVPATPQFERAFSVWTSAEEPTRLALAPAPLTLGHSAAWTSRYGYGADNVSSWVVAGRDSSLSVLKGSFNWGAIERSLRAASFAESTYHRAVLFTATAAGPSDNVIMDGDSSGSAKAVALLDGRLVAAASVDLAKAAIDAAQGRAPALADVAAIGGVLPSLQPMVGLMAIAQTDQAIACGVGRGWTYGAVVPAADQMVIVAYGSLGVGGEPRTLVAMTFPSEGQAEAAEPSYDEGWRVGFANAGGSGGALSTFGTVSNVSRVGAMLVAEVVNGTEAGWARAGVRYAVAVCSASASALPEGTPVPAASPPATPTGG